VQLKVVDLTVEETYGLRLSVLRHDTPTKAVSFTEDAWPNSWHLGIVSPDGDIVATSSWVPRPCVALAGDNAIQLRGMATSIALHGRGIGGVLLEAGCERARILGFELVWANARDRALGFYARHDFQVVGDGFIDTHTQLAHHVITRRLGALGSAPQPVEQI
jgi:GNAT superfamily N-acetyltransferase